MNYETISGEELVVACLQSGNEPAWTEFVRRFHPLIAGVIFRVARHWGEGTPQVVDDLIQETYLKLCSEGLRVLQDFEPVHKDALYGYIKVFAANLASDHFKRTHSKKRGGGTTAISEEEARPRPDPSNFTPAVLERQILLRQIDACLLSVASGADAERDRKIFWLYYRVGLTASAIAGLPTIGLSSKGVESTLLRMTRHVRERLATSKQELRSQEIVREGIQRSESL